MMSNKEFEEKMNALRSSDLETVEEAVRYLGDSADQRSIPQLLEMLPSEKDDNLRNVIALSLGKLKANDAVPLLMELIRRPEYKNKRGSLVYALIDLDCKGYFSDIVEMICTGSYEVCDHALTIFESLIDDVDFSEKLLATEKLKNQEKVELALPPSKHPKYDRIHFIRDALKLLE